MLVGFLEPRVLQIHLKSFQRKNFEIHLWFPSQSFTTGARPAPWITHPTVPRKTAPAYKYSLPDMQQLAIQVTNNPKREGLKPATHDKQRKFRKEWKSRFHKEMLAGYLESLGLKIHLNSFQRKNFQTHLWSAGQSHNWCKASSLNYTSNCLKEKCTCMKVFFAGLATVGKTIDSLS